MARNDAEVRIGADTKDAERALGSLQKNMSGLSKTLKVAAGAFAGIKLAQFTKNVLAASEALDNAANKTGFAVESLQELRYAAEQAGVSATQMDTALQRFSRRTGEAAVGTGVLFKEFQNLNIEIRNSDGSLRDIEGVFDDYITAIANASSEQEKLRLAVAAFDMEGANLVNLLKEGKIGYQDLRKEAQRLGIVVSKDVVTANARANQSLKRLEAQFGAISKIIVGSLAPSLENISDDFGEFLSDEQRVQAFADAVETLGSAIELAADAMILLGENFDFVAKSALSFGIAKNAGLFESLSKAVLDAEAKVRVFNIASSYTTKGLFGLNVVALRLGNALRALGPILKGMVGALARIVPIFVAIEAASWVFGKIAKDAEDSEIATNDATVALKLYNDQLKEIGKTEREALAREKERLQTKIATLNTDLIAQNYRDPLDVSPVDDASITQEEAAIQRINNLMTDYQKKIDKINEGLRTSTDEYKNQQAVIKQANKLVDDAVLAYEQQIQDIELAMQLSGQDLFYAQEKLKVQRELEKIGKTMTAWDEANLEFSLEELWALKEKSRIQDEYNAQLEQSKQRYQELVRAADPRVTAEQTRIDNLIALENYYVDTRLMSEESYYEALRAIEEQYRLEKYAAEESLQQRIDQLKQQSLQRELEQQGWNRDQAKDIAQTRVDFEKKSDMERVQFGIQQGAELFNSLGQMNEKAFKAAKAFNIANAIMNTYAAATKALAAYPPPFNFIAAAAAVAAGMAQVASIRSQSYSGRAGGGPVQEGKPYIVGEQGRELFVPQGAGKIVPNAGGDVVNVNFSITAMDTRGFDALLAERKPAIINMVRQAMNDKGNRASV